MTTITTTTTVRAITGMTTGAVAGATATGTDRLLPQGHPAPGPRSVQLKQGPCSQDTSVNRRPWVMGLTLCSR